MGGSREAGSLKMVCVTASVLMRMMTYFRYCLVGLVLDGHQLGPVYPVK